MAKKIMILFGCLVLFGLVIPYVSFADSQLAWDGSSGTVTGYRVYYGTSSGNHPNSHEVGSATQCALSSLPLNEKTTYYFVTRAYNDAGESGDSNEVSWTVPDTTPPDIVQNVNVD